MEEDSAERSCRVSQRYSYTITEDEDEDEFGVEITTPNGGSDSAICDTLEEAKAFCERTAAETQP